MNEKKWCVYIHTSPSNKAYIGITSKIPEKRWGKDGYRYNNNKYFWNAIQKYGWENFNHEIFADNLSKEEACDIERILIALFKTQNQEYGYNIASGGETNIFKHSEETKQKLRDIFKSRPVPVPIWEFAAKVNKGKPLSVEHKQKIKEKRMKYVYTDEVKKKISDAVKGEKHPNYGKHLSEETKRKIGESNKGKYVDGKSVYCVELDKYFSSGAEAGRELGIDYCHISDVCRGKRASTHGYHFKYRDYNFPEYIHKPVKKVPIFCITLNKYFDSISSASKYTGISNRSIKDVCDGNREITKGHKFRYLIDGEIVL